MLQEIIANEKDIVKYAGVKPLGEETPEERWSRVREYVEEDFKKETMIALKTTMESIMEFQVQDLIGSSRWEHNEDRPTYRNGYYERGLLSTMGHISLRVPRIRDGGIKFIALDRYRRRTREVDELILRMFLNGVSTRSVNEVLEPLVGRGMISAGLVSKVTKTLNKQVEKFHRRQINDKYEYLILDGIFLNAKSPVYKKSRCVLVAYGLWEDKNGNIRRELIDFQVASKGESQNAWERFLSGLSCRGLEGNNLKMITIDGNKGLYNAIGIIYPNASVQRCWVHKLRNVTKKLPRKLQETCISEARNIYDADNYSKAVRAYKKWAKDWRPIAPDAVKCLEEDLEELLNFYECPEKLWEKLRTTNAIERAFREVRKRNRESVERIIFAVFFRLNKNWGNDELKYLEDSLYEITQLC